MQRDRGLSSGAAKRQKWESAQREEHLEQVIKVGKQEGIKAVLPTKAEQNQKWAQQRGQPQSTASSRDGEK